MTWTMVTWTSLRRDRRSRPRVAPIVVLAVAALFADAAFVEGRGTQVSNRPRIFISTDLRLSSEEKDDAQSLIHALLYQDKMDIVGIAGTSSKWVHQDGLVGDIDKIIDVYAKDYSKLEAKHPAFK